MNSFIEHLNQSGGTFLRFVWPMLWQASLLIVLLLSLDYLGKRHVRASVRYALWLVVLVKLCAPPTLALPTSPVWWLHKTPAIIIPTATRQYSVSYDDQGTPGETPAAPSIVQQPRPVVTTGAGALAIATLVSASLLGWLLVRWAQIARRVRSAENSERLNNLVQAAQIQAGLHFPVPARVTVNSMSPAVCGLFQPVILIPQTLVETFSDEQLRAVLLHELIHLRRRDAWVNFAQALLQIVYWWHPLVWVANARIRSVREEAVDDAVVLTLRDEAEAYAPTLLAVAKLALRRPMVSLGLVGIMESRHALRQRIERLLDGGASRRTGLTLVSVLGIAAFTAVAVPMGEAPNTTLEAAPAGDSPHQPVLITAKFYAVPNLNDPQLALDIEHYNFKIGDEEKFAALTPVKRAAFEARLKKAGLRPFFSPRLETTDGVEGIISANDGTNIMKFSGCPVLSHGGIQLAFGAELPQNAAGDDRPMPAATVSDNVLTENQGGIYVDKTPMGTEKNHLLMIIEVQFDTNAEPATASPQIHAEATQMAIPPENTTNSDPRLVTSSGEPLFRRTFKVLPNLPVTAGGLPPDLNGIDMAVSNDVSALGIEWKSPETFYYSKKLGLLFVKATEGDLNKIEHGIFGSFHNPPQLHIKARFLEVPKGTWDGLEKFSLTTTNDHAALAGILTGQQLKSLLNKFQHDGKVDNLAEPEVTFTSGRQTQMRATTLFTVITNATYQRDPNGSNSLVFAMETEETGPILDTVARVLPDGYTVDLKASPFLADFLGYDHPVAESDPPIITPNFQVRQASAHIRLWDGQTLAFGNFKKHILTNGREEMAAKPEYFDTAGNLMPPVRQDSEMLVLITVILIDQAGNRFYSDDQTAFAQGGVPPQTGE